MGALHTAGAITLATTLRQHPAETVGEQEQEEEEVVEVVVVVVVVAADKRGHQAAAGVGDKYGHQEVAAAVGTQPTDTPISRSPCP